MSVTSKSTDLIKLNEKQTQLPIKFDPNSVNQALELVDKNPVWGKNLIFRGFDHLKLKAS